MGRVVFGDNETAAGVLVEAMNDPGTLFPSDPRQTGAVIEQRIDQSVFAMTCAGMNNEPRRLVDHDEIIVFEENRKRDRLWQGLDLFKRRFGELNLIAASNDVTWTAG